MMACQQGVGIVVGSVGLRTTAAARIYNNLLTGYQKSGIAISGPGSTAEVRTNQLIGAGPTDVIVQNGIQASSGATATISGNRVVGHSFTPFSLVATGILLFNANADTAANTLGENQVGIYLVDSSGGHDANLVTATAGGTRSPGYWGIIVDAPPPGRVPQPYDPLVTASAKARVAQVRLNNTDDALAVQTVTVTNNELSSDGSPGGIGLQADGGYGVLEIDLTATNNSVQGWNRGIYISQCSNNCSGSSYLSAVIRHNRITGNTSGFDNGSAGGLGVLAHENWWDAPTGPTVSANPGGDGDSHSGDAPFSPWLCSGTDTSPATGFQPETGALCGLAARLLFEQQPADAIEGALLSPQPVVRAVDAVGNPAPGFNHPVTLMIGPGGAAIAGPTTVAAVGGIATFSGLSINGIGDELVLIANSGLLPSLASTPFAIRPQLASVRLSVIVAGQSPNDGWRFTGGWGSVEIAATGGEQSLGELRANQSHTIAVAGKNGYTVTSSCSDGSIGGESITLTPAYQADIACIFTMTAQPATVTIIKRVVGQPPISTWRYNGDLGSFEAPAEGGAQQFTSAAGAVQIIEGDKAGYQSEVSCSDGAGGVRAVLLVLAPGEQVTCTFTATEQPAGIRVRKTVGLSADGCSEAEMIAVPAGTTVFYCYTITNSGEAPLALHNLEDSEAGMVFPALNLTLPPSARLSTVELGRTISATVEQTVVSRGTWTATTPEGSQTRGDAAATVNVLHAAIDVSLTASKDASKCSTTPLGKMKAGDMIALCVTIHNIGEVALNRHYVALPELEISLTLDRVIAPGVALSLLPADIPALGIVSVTQNVTHTLSVKSTNAPGDPADRTALYPAPELFFATDVASVWTEVSGNTDEERWLYLPAVVR